MISAEKYIFPAVIGAICTVTITLGGFAFTSYISLQARIENINSRVMVLENNQPKDEAFLVATRAALDKISAQISDLRVLIAEKLK